VELLEFSLRADQTGMMVTRMSVTSQTGSMTSALLSLVLAVFGISAVVSLLDDSLLVFFHRQDLTLTRSLLLFLMLAFGALAYGTMSIVPGVPKRVFLPVALFLPVSFVAVLPLLVFFHSHAAWIGWGVSLLQLLLAYLILRHLKQGTTIRWPLCPDSRLGERKFRWGNLTAMLLAALLVILPALLLGTALSAKLAVDHFTDGFVSLKPSGVTMQVRRYVRDDGSQITLVPMSHVGESGFYQEISDLFSDDSLVLMEGVSDRNKLAPRQSGYSRMARSIGVVEQQEAFRPRGEIVAADLDMSEFSPATRDMLKGILLVHSKGITAETMPILLKPTPPGFEKQLMDDILGKRNRHLLRVLHEKLPQGRHIVIPWGAAHMPEIAREIVKSGFRLAETRDFTAIRF
jgi:hypothetical protein